MAEAYEYLALLVPEAIGQKLKTRQQCDGFDRAEERICLVTLLKMVVRDAGAQVMNVVEPDIAGEPL